MEGLQWTVCLLQRAPEFTRVFRLAPTVGLILRRLERCRLSTTQGVAPELDAVGVVCQAVEDGVGEGGIAECLVSLRDRELAGDDGGAPLAAVLDDLEEIGGVLGR